MKLILLIVIASSVQAATFQERADSGKGDYGYAEIAARLERHEQPKWCSKKLEDLLAAGPTGDMFWMYPVTAIAYLDQGQLSPDARQALRSAWKTYMPYRGDTENHFLMYYTCLYLMSQYWPDAGLNSPPPVAKASTIPRTTWASISCPCRTSPPGPKTPP